MQGVSGNRLTPKEVTAATNVYNRLKICIQLSCYLQESLHDSCINLLESSLGTSTGEDVALHADIRLNEDPGIKLNKVEPDL